MQVIYSSWIVSGDEITEDRTIQTAPGVFDHALYDLCQKKLLPEWARNQFHFVESASGLKCLEAAQIQKLATEGKMTSDPNPSYVRTEVKASVTVAEHFLARLNVSEEDAKMWGNEFRAALERAEAMLHAQSA